MLCAAPVSGPLLIGVDEALVDLLGTTPADTPEAILESVQSLVEAVVATLTGVTGPEGETVADAIAGQLEDAGLDPAVITQILAGLELSGVDMPDSVLGDLLDNVTGTVEDLVSSLLGLGGQTPDPAVLQDLVDQITAALAGNDDAALQDLLAELLTSLPGGLNLTLTALTDLVDQLLTTLDGALGGGTGLPDVIREVETALNGGSTTAAAASATPTVSAPKAISTSRRPSLRGTGTPGATVSIRTSAGVRLGTAPVRSNGTFVVKSRKLKIAGYRVSATQVAPGRSTSAKSASRTFRVVSAKPVVTTKSKKKFKTNRPKITGIGYPKSRIILRSSTGKKLGSTRVRSNGTWTIKSKSLGKGTKKVKAVQTGYGKKKTSKVRTIRIR